MCLPGNPIQNILGCSYAMPEAPNVVCIAPGICNYGFIRAETSIRLRAPLAEASGGEMCRVRLPE